MRLSRLMMMMLAMLAIGMIAAACSSDEDEEVDSGDAGEVVASSDTLKTVLDRGKVIVGVKDSQPGFGNLNPDGTFAGQDVEYAHAIAAALFGDKSKVEFVVASAATRFELLSAEEIDVLIRTTTWTSSRDIDLSSSFTATTFYDGQGIIVNADSAINSINDLEGATICVTTGTTTEVNLANGLAAAGVNYTALTLAGDAEINEAFIAGRCEAWTGDKGNLAGQRSSFPAAEGGPESLRVLPETLSKEPLGPVVRDGDTDWYDVVQWVVFGTMAADELGVNSGNVVAMAANPPTKDIANLLGASFGGAEPSNFGTSLGLSPTFMQSVIGQVGNYDEIYERTIAPIGLAREGSLNASWLDGGLIYSPPIK
ncbi:MAG: amino acid ABC transporter substrate-binding protein [Chloroflexi bacterium]|nr:amino acid ABC transporter substrate-binding protein [Chloroflexota bacterium]MBT4073491.1 amino acid ABC transporter substrate-binding protein [Chloroflexota bacterium]MBT4515394.1 amino acid ABC transporter substrate-binding protein [Chloroflexota bacterium]MBT6682476.1 amino acid ABC transporter substrate-binding protein [Chloroflexota bacterium]